MAERQKITTSAVLFWTGVVLILMMGGVMAIFWNRLPPQLPWFYSLPWGDKQLIDKLWFAGMFGGMGGVILVTRFISAWAGKNDETIKNTVMTGGLMAVVLMLASFVRVMFIFLKQ